MSDARLPSSDGAAPSAAPSAFSGTPVPEAERVREFGRRADAASQSAHETSDESDVPEAVQRLACSIPAMALVSMFVFIATMAVATRTLRGQVWDERARLSTGSSARAWAHIVDPLTSISIATTGAALALFVGIALVRRRIALALAAVMIVVVANVSTQLLKAHWTPSPYLSPNSCPSGHTTVAMSLACAALAVTPRAARRWMLPLVGFGVTFVGCGTIVGHWHRPADVLAAIALTTFWTALALGIVQVVQRGRAVRERRYALRPVLGLSGSVVAGLVFLALGVRPLDHDVNLVLASVSLVGSGLAAAVALAWVSAAADDNVG